MLFPDSPFGEKILFCWRFMQQPGYPFVIKQENVNDSVLPRSGYLFVEKELFGFTFYAAARLPGCSQFT